ncbi:MAG TPA: hypothetical protein PKB14_22430 [Rubrivivax sp.]|nr:hypothetical protein [Rubrivivax sp.]
MLTRVRRNAAMGVRLRTVQAMDALTQALHGAASAPPVRPARAEVLLVLGGGGVLGAALLARALASGRFGRVQALVARPLASALRGFEPLPESRLGGALRADTAFIVFERARRNNGRDDAFVQPQAPQLPALAEQLRRGGVRRLLVLVPHAPALLPQALKSGFASLDEAGVAALDFEQLLFVRAAQAGGGAPTQGWTQRLAAGWLGQLAWMVPTREQPVRAALLAELAVELAWRLPEAPPATRVLPPELLWQAAQAGDGGALLGAWLHGEALPQARVPRRRW